VQTVPLQQLLTEHKILDIDLLSVDVEGAELPVMQSINWLITRVEVILVENNYREEKVGNFLRTKGFKFVKRIRQDEVFVRSDR